MADPVSTGGDLNAFLGLATTPNWDLLTVSRVMATWSRSASQGFQVEEKTISPGGGGAPALFGLALSRDGSTFSFVDDSENQLNVLR